MQEEPVKTLRNYNEIYGARPAVTLPRGVIEIQPDGYTSEQRTVIATGLGLVHDKIDEVLGTGNRLTSGDLPYPEVSFIATYPERPNVAGFFRPGNNRIGIVTDKIPSGMRGQIKVFVHEIFHFLSHNGRDDGEQVDEGSPMAKRNNVGFHRDFGLDIRAGKEGEETSDYFLGFNEGITEQLAIDVLPGVHETYDDYRGLFNQVVDDAVVQGLGSRDESGRFQPWSRGQMKDYIYGCFLRGNLDGFTRLLQSIYKKDDISEQQFGLMTHRDDLPSVIESSWADNHPDDPPPSPASVGAMVQARLDSKVPDDYVTDIIDPEPDGGSNAESRYGAEYDAWIRDHGIKISTDDRDSWGGIIYRDEEAASILREVKQVLDELLVKVALREIDIETLTERMDELLFDIHGMSMLTDGYRDFYIYKHEKIDNL